MEALSLYIPRLGELGFYAKMLEDPATMAYNAPWYPPDGCISFPRERWLDWYGQWFGQEPNRFYAYLRRTEDGVFVGGVEYHRSPERDWWDLGVLIYAPERGKGYGSQGLALLLELAFRSGVTCLHNEFEASRTAALRMHLHAGFREIARQDDIIHLMLTREDYLHRDRSGRRERPSAGMSRQLRGLPSDSTILSGRDSS